MLCKMPYKTQYMKNRNLIYSSIFFVLANLTLFLDPLEKARDFIFSFPPSIKSKLLFSDLFPIFEQITGSMIIFVLIFSICSIYFSIQFMRKDFSDKKLFGLVPNNSVGFFALLFIIIPAIYIKMILVEFMIYL